MKRFGFLVTDSIDNTDQRVNGNSLDATINGCVSETQIWYARIIANGGSVSVSDILIADRLMRQIKASSYRANIIYLLPYIGNVIRAAVVPLIDDKNAGIAGNYGNSNNTPFVDADCSTATGLTNTASSGKFLCIQGPNFFAGPRAAIAPLGIGHYERNYGGSASNSEVMAVYNNANTLRFNIDLRPAGGTAREAFTFGTPANSALNSGVAAGTNHYYGEASSSALRTLYRNGTSVASNSTSEPLPGVVGACFFIGAGNDTPGSTSAGGPSIAMRSGCNYVTDGGLGSTNAAAFHTLLTTYLITATGR